MMNASLISMYLKLTLRHHHGDHQSETSEINHVLHDYTRQSVSLKMVNRRLDSVDTMVFRYFPLLITIFVQHARNSYLISCSIRASPSREESPERQKVLSLQCTTQVCAQPSSLFDRPSRCLYFRLIQSVV